ncbi:MAG: biotin--[acetyl-CoA-carboxylase] ligase [Mycobacteriaceae bacterium]|uniref:biotin--[acetyl-CoA-carboxylase] ligase n=1 Tax=Corynebacterium sp. TaxID=1720 RepID=UPI003F9A3755
MDDTSAPHPSRSPMDADRIRARLEGVPVGDLVCTGTTGSTNTDLAGTYRDSGGAAPADRTVRFAEEQVTARGRLGRPWSAPSGAQVIFSALLRPDASQVTPERFGELPLFVGVAIAEAARGFGVDAVLKWPNDVVVLDTDAPHGYRKLAGILVEAASVDPPAIIAGVGLNTSLTTEEFADAGLDAATSMILQGAPISDTHGREALAAAEIRQLLAVDAAWRSGGDALADLHRRYRGLSCTLGTRVRAELPGGSTVTGTAVDLGDHGELVIEVAGTGERRTVTAGDVVHLRPAGA